MKGAVNAASGTSINSFAHIFIMFLTKILVSVKPDTNGARNASPTDVAAAPKAEAKKKDFGDPVLDDFKDHYNVIFIGHVGRLLLDPCF